jgi:hypothetical protein
VDGCDGVGGLGTWGGHDEWRRTWGEGGGVGGMWSVMGR